MERILRCRFSWRRPNSVPAVGIALAEDLVVSLSLVLQWANVGAEVRGCRRCLELLCCGYVSLRNFIEQM